jgi:hypothetical protein
MKRTCLETINLVGQNVAQGWDYGRKFRLLLELEGIMDKVGFFCARSSMTTPNKYDHQKLLQVVLSLGTSKS